MKKSYFLIFLFILLVFMITGCETIYFDDYKARGVVVDENSNGIPNVSVYFDDGSHIETREDGTWTKTGLKGEVVVRPQKSGYSFSPSNLTISNVEDNNNIEFIGTKTNEETENTSYTARGVVLDENNNGIPDVSVYFDDDVPIETREDGTWAKTGLEGEVVVRPQKSGYTFNPANLAISHIEENNNIEFIGAKTENNRYTVSGQITYNGNPLPGVTLQFSDESSQVETDLEGNWEKSDLTGQLVVTPTLEDWQFSPANATLTSDNDEIDFKAEPTENFSYYTLSGNVIDDDANGVPGVKIEIRRASDNTLLDIAFTGVNSDGDNSGNWTSSGLWGEVIIIPIPASKDNISSFDPPSLNKSGEAENVDFKAILN